MPSSRQSLLFVTEVFPFPLDRGQHVRVWNLLLACSEACDVTFVAPPPPAGIDRSEVEALCQRVVYVSERPRWPELRHLPETLRLAPGFRSLATLRRYEPYVAALHELGPQNFDLIWAERPQMACLCRDFWGRTILDFDDIEHLKTARRFEIEQGVMRRLRNAYSYAFYRRLELKLARSCLGSVVCSDQDGDYLVRHGCRNPIVVPNAASSAPIEVTPSRRPRSATSPLRLLFLGHLASVPNTDAIEFLLDEILPGVRAEFPDVVLDVIGGGTVPANAEGLAPGVRYRGFVEDLASAFSDYDMMVAPLRFGGGTKLKVLDAMAHGLPVVTTSVGTQGLPVEHDEHVLVAEAARGIIDAIARLKRDPAFAARLAGNAYALVRDRFSWSAIQRDLTARLPALAAAGDRFAAAR